jgi:hypothetical protein
VGAKASSPAAYHNEDRGASGGKAGVDARGGSGIRSAGLLTAAAREAYNSTAGGGGGDRDGGRGVASVLESPLCSDVVQQYTRTLTFENL